MHSIINRKIGETLSREPSNSIINCYRIYVHCLNGIISSCVIYTTSLARREAKLHEGEWPELLSFIISESKLADKEWEINRGTGRKSRKMEKRKKSGRLTGCSHAKKQLKKPKNFAPPWRKPAEPHWYLAWRNLPSQILANRLFNPLNRLQIFY